MAKKSSLEQFGIQTERQFVERLAGMGLPVIGTEAEQLGNIRSIAQALLMARTAAVDVAKESR